MKISRKITALLTFIGLALSITPSVQPPVVGAAALPGETYFWGFEDKTLPRDFSTTYINGTFTDDGIWQITPGERAGGANPRITINKSFEAESVNCLKIRVKHELDETEPALASIKVYYSVLTDGAQSQLNESNKFVLSNIAPSTNGKYVTYTVPFTGKSTYRGTVAYIRVDLLNKYAADGTTVDVDYIMLCKADSAIPAWDFTTADQISPTAANDVWVYAGSGGQSGNTTRVEDGVLKVTIGSQRDYTSGGTVVPGGDPAVVQLKLTPQIPIETSEYDYLEVIMKHDTSAGTSVKGDKAAMKLYLQGYLYAADGTKTAFSMSENNKKVINLTQTSGNSCIRYIYPLSGNMTGGTSIDNAQITVMRLDPIRDQGTCEIDSIRLVPKRRAVAFGEVKTYNSGVLSDKFRAGTVTVGVDTEIENETVDAMAVLAQYDSASRLIACNAQHHEMTESGRADVSLTVDAAEDTYLKYFLLETGTQRPLISAKTIYPYSESVIESVEKKYPGFTTKAATFSFDDGVAQDIQTIASLNKYGAKATFNVVAKRSDGETDRLLGNYSDKGTTDEERFEYIKALYSPHEIANHSYSHPSAGLMEGQTSTNSSGAVLEGISGAALVEDMMKNHRYIKDNLDIEMSGIAWPQSNAYGRSDYETVRNGLLNNGYKYARWHTDTMSFDLPADWMQWKTSGHIAKTEQLTDAFISLSESDGLKLLYIWGHSYEYADPARYGSGTWEDLERNLAKLADDNVWFATNKEVYDYINAVNKITEYPNAVKNNSDTTVYITVNGVNAELSSGETYYLNASQQDLPSIACWGDSLTYGQGSSNRQTCSYPGVLAKLTGATVYNFGVPGETSMTIAARQGARDIELAESCTVPASSTDEVEIKLAVSGGGKVTPRLLNVGGWSPCIINGVEGVLSRIEYDTSVTPRIVKKAFFKRNVSGAAVNAEAGDKLIPDAQRVRADINIIFSGTNGGWTADNTSRTADIPELIDLIDSQRKLSNNPDKYIVIGLTTKDGNQWVPLDNAMEESFGEHFLNVKQFLSSVEALELAGVEPTANDIDCIARGAVPDSLLSGDGVHFNDAGYAIIAAKVHEKLVQLGYLE